MLQVICVKGQVIYGKGQVICGKGQVICGKQGWEFAHLAQIK